MACLASEVRTTMAMVHLGNVRVCWFLGGFAHSGSPGTVFTSAFRPQAIIYPHSRPTTSDERSDIVLKTDDCWFGILAADLAFMFILTYVPYFPAFDRRHSSALFVILGSEPPSIVSTSYTVAYISVVSLTELIRSY